MNETTSATSPETRRRLLRAELIRLRRQNGLTQEQVARSVFWSTSKLIRIEGGHNSITLSDLEALLSLYHVKSEIERERLYTAAREARRRSSWHQFRDILTPTEAEYLGSEEAATFIRVFDPLVIPPLLQTEEYARALLRQSYRFPPGDVERRIQLQLQRQEQLDRADPPRLYVVLDEPAVRRLVGGPTIMRRQLSQLLVVGLRDLVTVRVLPFSAGATPSVLGGFTHLEFEVSLTDLVLAKNELLAAESSDQVANYADVFEELVVLAYTASDSAEFIQQLIGELASDAEPDLVDELEQHFVL